MKRKKEEKMFREVAEELCRAEQKIGERYLLPMAPAYIFSIKNEEHASVRHSLNVLMERMEEQKILSEQTDGYLYLFLEYGILVTGNQETLGFSDETGCFRRTLEQWVFDLDREYQIRQGIIVIRINWSKEMLSETVWWSQFFRYLHRYKQDFLFLFLTEGKDAVRGNEMLDKRYFCRQMQIHPYSAEEYRDIFLHELKGVGLSLDEYGESVLMDILRCHEHNMNSHILTRWEQELVWEFYLYEEQKQNKCMVLPASFIAEERLKKYIQNERISYGIGFELNGD